MSKGHDTTSDTASFSARLADWRARGEKHELAGHGVFVHKAGDWTDATRPTLTLIHGFPTSSWDWHRLWPELDHVRCLVRRRTDPLLPERVQQRDQEERIAA